MTGKSFLRRGIWWFLSWAVLIALGLDFFNWGKSPRLLWGIPDWLWWDVVVVLLSAMIFGLLSHFAWDEK